MTHEKAVNVATSRPVSTIVRTSITDVGSKPMVPYFIHAFWHSEADQALPQDVWRNLDAWRATHPRFQLKVWSLVDVRPTLSKVPGAEEAVDSCRFIAMQADIVRLALLVTYGGIWTDLKNRPLQPFLSGLLNKSEAIFAEHFPSLVKEFPRGHINNCFIVSSPQHPFLNVCLQEAVSLVLRRQAGSLWNITGAGMIMRMMRGREGWCILPFADVWGPRGGGGAWMIRTKASYSKAGQHWSERQEIESLYL
jgi:mannosyltransferase OCH1-like enzyme